MLIELAMLSDPTEFQLPLFLLCGTLPTELSS